MSDQVTAGARSNASDVVTKVILLIIVLNKICGEDSAKFATMRNRYAGESFPPIRQSQGIKEAAGMAEIGGAVGTGRGVHHGADI